MFGLKLAHIPRAALGGRDELAEGLVEPVVASPAEVGGFLRHRAVRSDHAFD